MVQESGTSGSGKIAKAGSSSLRRTLDMDADDGSGTILTLVPRPAYRRQACP